MDLHLNFKFSQDVAAVFAAWISEGSIVAPVIKIEIDPVPGGVFRLTSGTPDNVAVMDGEILEIEQNKRIKYTWHWGGSAPPSIVDVHFIEMNGATQLEISHSGLDSEDAVRGYEAGWNTYIDGLKALL